MKRMVFALALGLLGFSASSARAQESKSKCKDEADKGGTKFEVVRGPDGRKVFKLKGICIEVHVPKPSVIYVLNASTINYEWENLKYNFLGNSVHAVEQSPF